jgi:hypothetical protein
MICYSLPPVAVSIFDPSSHLKQNVMKQLTKNFAFIITIMLFTAYSSIAQKTTAANQSTNQKHTTMKTYLIEREIPDAGKLTPEQLKGISQKSCSVLKEMGPQIEWIQSYVTGNKIYCIYKAESAELIREHAIKGGFPANVITEINTVISPATATGN